MSTPNTSHTLPSKEKLKSHTLIERLFQKGNNLFVFPFKLIYIKIDESHRTTASFLFGVTVPKRLHKSAVKRNLLKRRTREAYRKNKPVISADSACLDRYALMYILVDKNITDSQLIDRSMKKLNLKLSTSLRSPKE